MKAAKDREVCVICAGALSGRQSKFCSRHCKNSYTNYHHQSYRRQQERGRERKLKLIEQMGGQCSSCGYKRNFSALEFHHRVPSDKSFQLDMRSLANLDWSAILLEVGKCILLCANCHAEHHNPDSRL